VRWDEALDKVLDPAQRLGLRIRIFEQALPAQVGDSKDTWIGAAGRYLRETWCQYELGLWLRDAAFAALEVTPGRREGSSSEEGKRWMDLEEELMPSAGRLRFHFHGDAALRRLPLLASEMPEGTMYQRVLDELARRTATGEAAAAWLDAFAQRFDKLLARTVRVRNAILHGAPTVPGVIASVEPFAQQLTARVIGEQLYAVTSDMSIEQVMEDVRYDAIERRIRLERGEHPADVLFQSTADAG
jgi:hypothetical protein